MCGGRLSEVFNSTLAAGEQWLSPVGFTREPHSSDGTSVSREAGGCFGKGEEGTGTGG